MARAGGWTDDKMCAVHNGTINAFGYARQRISALGEYDPNYQRNPIAKLMGSGKFALLEQRGPGREGVILVNGFLTEGVHSIDEWKPQLHAYHRDYSFIHVDWEAHKKLDAVINAADILLTGALMLPRLLTSTSWHSAQSNARSAGARLADAISCTNGWTFTLAGHSLGASVIHHALIELAGRGIKCVDNAFLLGGAIGGDEKQKPGWDRAAQAVRGTIFNCYSSQDDVLAYLYRISHFGLSCPAGLRGIASPAEQIVNVNCSAIVPGHTKWKSNLTPILKKIYGGA